jgi:flavodoxin
MVNTNKKTLIAYYSRKGNNYVNGSIVNLLTGNTETIANKILDITGGDLFKIDTIKPYPSDYTETTRVARDELRSNARPGLHATVKDLENYDVIYLGYPNWWGTSPMAVFTFLESYDFSGKTIVPFCTHEGSGLGKSILDIKKVCPDSNVLNGLSIRGSEVGNAHDKILGWLKELGLVN